MFSIQKSELVAVHNYKVDNLEICLNFRLEIYKSLNSYQGLVFKYDMYRVLGSFPHNKKGNPYLEADVSLLAVDDFFDTKSLVGSSLDEVIIAFEQKLQSITSL